MTQVFEIIMISALLLYYFPVSSTAHSSKCRLVFPPPTEAPKVTFCPVGSNASSALDLARNHLYNATSFSPSRLHCTLPHPAPPRNYSFLGNYAYHTFFPNLTGGTFLELGALDGVLLSNTQFFEDRRGWSGLLVEASPVMFPHLCVNRPCSHRVRAAICNTANRQLHFIQLPAAPLGNHWAGLVGGIYEFMTESYRNTYYTCPAMATVTPVQCHSLQALLDFFHITHVDFFSLDVEGSELEVLQTLNFSRTEVDVIVVELSHHDPVRDLRIVQLLVQSHFVFHGNRDVDFWFAREGTPYALAEDTLAELEAKDHPPAPPPQHSASENPPQRRHSSRRRR